MRWAGEAGALEKRRFGPVADDEQHAFEVAAERAEFDLGPARSCRHFYDNPPVQQDIVHEGERIAASVYGGIEIGIDDVAFPGLRRIEVRDLDTPRRGDAFGGPVVVRTRCVSFVPGVGIGVFPGVRPRLGQGHVLKRRKTRSAVQPRGIERPVPELSAVLQDTRMEQFRGGHVPDSARRA